MFIMGSATILAWVLTYAEVPDMVAHAAAGLQDPYLFLLIVNLLVLFVGMWMDPTATIVVLTPILLPIAVSLGVHPVHFGVVFVYNLMIGMVTPPVGYVLYITSAIGDVSIERIVRVLSPFLILHVAVLLFITYAPWVVMIVPQILGYR
jgi:tripartite ATP-independent transporter DctM subunit